MHTYSVSANVALTVAQTVTNIAGTPVKIKINKIKNINKRFLCNHHHEKMH